MGSLFKEQHMETIIGFLAAIGTAVAKSALDVSTKYATATLEGRSIIALQWCVSATLLTIACVVWYPSLLSDPTATFAQITNENFWWVLLLNGALNAVASYFYISAFRHADASLVAPFMLITPVLLLVTSPLMLGEHVPPMGVIGVLCTVVGAHYVGKSIGESRGVWSSLRALAKNRGVRLMALTAVIWSITSNLDKIGVQSATPLFWSASISIVIALTSVAFWLVTPKRTNERDLWRAALPGIANAIGILLHVYALTILFVPYVIAIKRLSAPLTVILGGSLFGEKTKERLTGTLIMLLGTLLMVLSI